jgi:hypothetical protein
MSGHLLSASCALLMLAGACVGAAETKRPTSQEGSSPLTRFSHFMGDFLRQLDGSAVCAHATHAYLSTDDFRRWSQVPVNTEPPIELANLRPAGGDRKRLFFVMTQQGERRLLAVDVGASASVLRNVPPQPVAFASGELGAAAVQFSVVLTQDGGKTWAHAARLAGSEDVSALLWLSESRLLVGGRRGAVQLFERQGNKPRRLWAITLPQTAAYAFASGGEYVWARAGSVNLRMPDLREAAFFRCRTGRTPPASCGPIAVARGLIGESLPAGRKPPPRNPEEQYQDASPVSRYHGNRG